MQNYFECFYQEKMFQIYLDFIPTVPKHRVYLIYKKFCCSETDVPYIVLASLKPLCNPGMALNSPIPAAAS